MSAMKFREPNEVLWRGVRPAHKGEQVVKGNTVNNGTSIVHTVSTGKTLYLTALAFSVYAGVGESNMFVRNAADVTQYYFFVNTIFTAGGAGSMGNLSFNPPLEIPAGYDICVSSNAAANFAYGFIHGWEE